MTSPKKRILVVEDDPGLTQLFGDRLERAGIGCDAVASGQACLDWLEQHSPDILLLDYVLPDMLAPALVDQLWKADRLPPFIVITGHGDERVAVELMKLGARDYLVKDSLLLDRLPAVVKRTLQEVENERRLATTEAALRHSENLFRRTFDEAPAGTAIVNLNLFFLRANAAFCRFIGYTEEELRGLRFAQITHPDDIAASVEQARQLLTGETAEFVMEKRYVRKDGAVVWGHVSVRLIRDAEGRPLHLIPIIQDITERKQTEEALRDANQKLRASQTATLSLLEDLRAENASRKASETRFRRLFEMAPLPMCLVGKDGTIRFRNERFVQVFGYTADKVRTLAEWWLHAYPDADYRAWAAELWNKAVQHAAQEGRDIEPGIREVTCQSGEKRIVEISGITLGEDYLTTFIDLTERKRYENRLQLLIGVIQKFATAHDVETVVAAVRSTARHLTGADGATVILREDEQCYYADEDAIAPLWKGQRFPLQNCIGGWTMLHRQPVVIADIYADPRIPVAAYRPTFVQSLAMVPIRTADPLGAIGNYWARHHTPAPEDLQLLQSLADAAAIALENVRSYTELEQRVRARTAELETKNKELETFTYSVSHDLKAPLRGIEGYSRLLMEDYPERLDDNGRRFLNTIRQATLHMGRLIDDLLAYSRLERRSWRSRPIQPRAIAETLLGERADEAQTRGVTLRMDVPPTTVPADPDGLTLALRNLLDNALKFTAGAPHPAIEIAGRETPDTFILSVHDNGVGFDMKFHDRIFEIFQRLHRAEDYEGTGIGLAIVRKAMERMGGRVWAESEPGHGATFFLEIPKTAKEE
jgi:PAS domain S-box-containing protein